jgi:hypothetical protein
MAAEDRFDEGDPGKRLFMDRLSRPSRGTVCAFGVAFLLYLVAGHGFHPGQTMDEAAVGAGICIVLVTVLAAATLARPACLTAPFAALVGTTLAPSRRSVHAPNPRARASPVWLQRFLN